MKKIGISLVGVSHDDYDESLVYHRDWNSCKDNLKNNLIDCFRKENLVNVYLTTYDNSEITNILNFYRPTKQLILSVMNSHQRLTYIKSLENLLDEDLDFIVASRIDIKYNDLVSNYNFDYDKVNFIFKDVEPHWSNTKYVGDALFGIPKKYLQQFIDCIKVIHQFNGWYMHPIYHVMQNYIGDNNIHFLFNEHFLSNENSIYNLTRVKK
jgi:hypothetical protein